MKNITQNTYNYLWERLNYQGKAGFTGGENRKYSGETVESCIDVIINMFKEFYPSLNIEVRGDSDKIKVYGKNGAFTEESVDRHIYINGKFALAIECKTYLDKCYLQRAADDFRLIKKGTKNSIQTWVVSLENAISDMAYNFFMYEDDNTYINECFFLSDGKRASSRPIYKNNNFETRLNIDKIQYMIEKFENFFNQYVKNL
jgi:hypothetical protein